MWNRIRTGVAALGVLSVLAACGGDGSGSASSAEPDSVSVAWNTASDLDVLANDHSVYGTLTLSAVTTPAHGTASIEDGKLVYTPSAGYFGADSLTYTATDANGNAATAEVAVTVTATVTVDGTVADAPLAKAALTATAGDQSSTATTGDDGSYTLKLQLADPAAPVLLVATGAGAQSKVKLQSFLGDAAALVSHAGADGTIDADHLASTNVSGITTALAALVAEANGGTLPATQADFDRHAAALSINRVIDLATAIKLVADNGVALPSGASDTMALIADPSTSSVLAAFMKAQAATNADAYNTVRATFASVAMGTSAPQVAAGGPQSVVYYVAMTGSALGTVATYRPDGTATVVDAENGSHTARWVVANGALDVTLDTPISITTYSADVDPVTQEQYQIRSDTTGYRYLQVSGSTSNGTVLWVSLGSTTILDGSNAGKVEPMDASSGSLVKVMDLATAPHLAAADFPAGALWAGVQTDAPLQFGASVDTLSITDGSKAALQRTGAAYTWSITDAGQLKLSNASGGDRRYTRLAVDAATGLEYWLVADYEGGVPVSSMETKMAPVTPGLRFAAQTSFYRKWISGFNTFIPTDSLFFIGAFADGTGEQAEIMPDGSTASSSPSTWTIAADGSVTFARSSSTRQWYLLRSSSSAIVVMENLAVDPQFPNWRVNLYTDGGAETK